MTPGRHKSKKEWMGSAFSGAAFSRSAALAGLMTPAGPLPFIPLCILSSSPGKDFPKHTVSVSDSKLTGANKNNLIQSYAHFLKIKIELLMLTLYHFHWSEFLVLKIMAGKYLSPPTAAKIFH